MKVTGIVLAAGDSTRYNRGINKNLDEVSGKSILSYSLDIFSRSSKIDEILIVYRLKDRDDIVKVIENEDITKPIRMIKGGSTRQESVYNALLESNGDIVVIHDGARPAFREEYIDSCLEECSHYKGVIVGVKSKDTIKVVNDNGEIVSSTDRNYTWNAQTPQCFDRSLLLSLHEKYRNVFVTDDAMLLEMDGYPVKMIEGDYSNIKVTTYDDYLDIKKYLKERRL